MGRKLTTEEFINKSTAIHGDLYDYTKVDYKSSQSKVIIGCKKHGDFIQTPNNHLRNRGCPICFGVVKHTFETLSELINKKHNNTVTLMEGQVINGIANKYIFQHICRYKWFTRANDILSGDSCPKCSVHGFNPDKPAVFYILDVNGASKFTGFGISNNYKTRKSAHKKNLKNSNCSIVTEILVSSHGAILQELEKYIKQTLQCNNSKIKGFKTESVLITPESLLDFCKEWLISNEKDFTISTFNILHHPSKIT